MISKLIKKANKALCNKQIGDTHKPESSNSSDDEKQ
jgi:hypothetical protein